MTNDRTPPKALSTEKLGEATKSIAQAAAPLKKQAATQKRAHLLSMATEILHELKKQDGLNLENSQSLAAISGTLNAIAEALINTTETQPQILELLTKIEEYQKPKSIFKRAAIGTLKAPFQLLGATLKTIGLTVSIPALIAIGVSIGNGNDPMDIPKNVANWTEKHEIFEKLGVKSDIPSLPTLPPYETLEPLEF